MPAQAGIQGDSALASGYTAWIPGLALLARNDVPAGYPSSLLWRFSRLAMSATNSSLVGDVHATLGFPLVIPTYITTLLCFLVWLTTES